jgi:hypothetical protein
MGDVFEKYSDPEAEPLTHLPPKHLLYYNLGLKMPGGPIEEEEDTPRSDDDKDEDLPGGGGSEVKLMASSRWKPNLPYHYLAPSLLPLSSSLSHFPVLPQPASLPHLASSSLSLLRDLRLLYTDTSAIVAAAHARVGREEASSRRLICRTVRIGPAAHQSSA